MKLKWGILTGLVALASALGTQAGSEIMNEWKIVHSAGAWSLTRDGTPFFIKGAVGWNRLDLLAASGGNAVRAPARREAFDAAHAAGLVVMADLPVYGERDGMDWGDPAQLAVVKAKVLERVTDLRDHPALLFWVVGNELDWNPGHPGHHPDLWKRHNDLAVAIKAIDPAHPVLTVVGTGDFETKLHEMAAACTAFDLLGINTYGDIGEVTRQTREIWNRPYVLAEWGPTGHWQVPKTPWGAPIEQTSSEKAAGIRERYETSILGDRTHLLGSFVFYWSEKQETTHTWYGLFRDGLPTESIDTLQWLWTGSWPENRVPQLQSLSVLGAADPKAVILKAGQAFQAEGVATDPEGDALTWRWEIRPEVHVPEDSYAGQGEVPVGPIAGLIRSSEDGRVTFVAPEQAGPYRIFVTVLDGKGGAAYANLPFLVED